MAIRIQVSSGDQSVDRRFDQVEIVVGRPGPTATPALDLSPDTTVSRTHARIWEAGTRIWIEDLNSRHGTFVNGVKINYRRELQAGDLVQIGETTLRVEIPGAKSDHS